MLTTLESPPEVPNPPADETWVFDVRGMDCADCARTVEEGVARLPGVVAAKINFGAATLRVVPAAGLTEEAVTRSVAAAGYTAQSRATRPTVDTEPWLRRNRRGIELGIAALLWLAAFATEQFADRSGIEAAAYLSATLIAAYPFFRSAWYALKNRRADMNLLMTIAVVGAVVLGEYSEAASVAILFGFGLLLQSLALERTRNAIRGLMELAPATARVRYGNEELTIPVAQVRLGDVLLVKPGERFPIDGTVIEGASSADQSAMTGESVPVAIEPGSVAMAGTMNLDGAVEVRATTTVTDTSLAHVIALIEDAESSRAPAQAFIDRFAAIYTPVVVGLALMIATLVPLLVGDFHEWAYRALVLLVVACPCALVISTPVALVSAIGAGSRQGVLFKGGASIESLAGVQTIAFDKTGTLTAGHPIVNAVLPLGDLNEGELLARAAAVERLTSHPIARAIEREATHRHLQLPSVSNGRTFPGQGASATIDGRTVYVGSRRLFRAIPEDSQKTIESAEADGATVVLVGDEDVRGLIILSDPLRSTALETVRALHDLDLATVMLTGDHQIVAEQIATAAGVPMVQAGLMPADKVAAIAELESSGPVAMIGDGINDAPAMAKASVGIVMGISGADVAIEAADMVLMRDDLSQLPFAVGLARKTIGVIRQNVAASVLVKAAFLILTFIGATNLWLAVLADMGMSLLVTMNALRLLRHK